MKTAEQKPTEKTESQASPFSVSSVPSCEPLDVPLHHLTPREREVLKLLADGLGLKGAAQAQCRTWGTINKQRTSLYRKLGVHNLTELTRYAIRQGVIQP